MVFLSSPLLIEALGIGVVDIAPFPAVQEALDAEDVVDLAPPVGEHHPEQLSEAALAKVVDPVRGCDDVCLPCARAERMSESTRRRNAASKALVHPPPPPFHAVYLHDRRPNPLIEGRVVAVDPSLVEALFMGVLLVSLLVLDLLSRIYLARRYRLGFDITVKRSFRTGMLWMGDEDMVDELPLRQAFLHRLSRAFDLVPGHVEALPGLDEPGVGLGLRRLR